jgi:hypothetical protein
VRKNEKCKNILSFFWKFIMNKKQILASLNKIACDLDSSGLYKEANSLTDVMHRISQTDEISGHYPQREVDFNDSDDDDTEFNNDDSAFFEKFLDENGDFAIVHYPGIFGRRHKVKFGMKGLLIPGQQVVVDWDSNQIIDVMPIDHQEAKFNIDVMRTKINQ